MGSEAGIRDFRSKYLEKMHPGSSESIWPIAILKKKLNKSIPFQA